MKKSKLTVFTAFIAISIISVFLGSGITKAALFTGNDWMKLKNTQKVAEVKAYINTLHSQGVEVKKDPIFYCKKLDAVYAKHPNLKKEEVANTLKTAMIMEYDWEEKGVDKDTLAREWLGEKLYNKNKARREKQR